MLPGVNHAQPYSYETHESLINEPNTKERKRQISIWQIKSTYLRWQLHKAPNLWLKALKNATRSTSREKEKTRQIDRHPKW